MVDVSESPGLGVDYDWEWIEKKSLERIIV
jgi:L-alanine-DL-glutamate epimerase-like enolase superfamily enzyme